MFQTIEGLLGKAGQLKCIYIRNYFLPYFMSETTNIELFLEERTSFKQDSENEVMVSCFIC